MSEHLEMQDNLEIRLRDGNVSANAGVARSAFKFFGEMECDSLRQGVIDMTRVEYPPELTCKTLSYCIAFAHFKKENLPVDRPSGKELRVVLEYLNAEDLFFSAIDSILYPFDLDNLNKVVCLHQYVSNNANALLEALFTYRLEAAKMLLDHVSKAHLEQVNATGSTPLILAITRFDDRDLQFAILQRGIDYGSKAHEVVNVYGNTALIFAIGKGYDELALRIMEHVTDAKHLECVGNYGITALIRAIEQGYEGLALLIMEHVSNEHIEHVDNQGITALILAIEQGYEGLALRIIERVSTEHIKHIGALTIAIEHENIVITSAIVIRLYPELCPLITI